MSGAQSAADFAAEMREHGEEMTLRRMPSTDVTVWGKCFQPKGGARGDPVAGASSARQATLNVKISEAEIADASWPGPPRHGDRLIIGTRHYILEGDADTRSDGGVTLGHFLVVKGGPAV